MEKYMLCPSVDEGKYQISGTHVAHEVTVTLHTWLNTIKGIIVLAPLPNRQFCVCSRTSKSPFVLSLRNLGWIYLILTHYLNYYHTELLKHFNVI